MPGDAPGLSPGGFSPSCREQKLSFLPARENRSHARPRTRKEPRACEAGQRHKQGTRFARRSRATCPPQARVFSRPQGTGGQAFSCPGKQKLGEGSHPETTACVRGSNADTNTVRVLPTAGAGAVRGHAPGNNRGRVRLGEKRGRANRFAGGRRTTGCIAGDKAACADSPAPGRRVRELPAAGGL